jgi:hypothetical protein
MMDPQSARSASRRRALRDENISPQRPRSVPESPETFDRQPGFRDHTDVRQFAQFSTNGGPGDA